VFARGRKPDGTEVVALNVSCIDGVELAKLAMTPIDGRNPSLVRNPSPGAELVPGRREKPIRVRRPLPAGEVQ
jgi:hypothetical protein